MNAGARKKIMNPLTGRMVFASGYTAKQISKEPMNVIKAKITEREEAEANKIAKKIAMVVPKVAKDLDRESAETEATIKAKITAKKNIKITNAIGIFQNIISQNGPSGRLLTEDLGKIFEKSICMLYNTPYVGKYSYGNQKPTLLKERIQALTQLFPTLKHTAAKGALHNFTSENSSLHLSAKTSKKKNGKVAPQKIGQATKKKFLEYFKLPLDATDQEIKTFIRSDIVHILNEYVKYTFDDKIIYYNEFTNTVMFVEKIAPIIFDINKIRFGCLTKQQNWSGGGTMLIYDNKYLGEFQIHSTRSCVKFRWFFENVILLFPNSFKVTLL